jgi:hypothetical protein
MLSLITRTLFAIVIVTLASALLFHASSSTLQNVNLRGSAISGRVLDAHGEPVSGALISAEPSDSIMLHLPSSFTNKNGEFVIRGVTPGQYTLHTRKEDAGYPRSEFNFYDKHDTIDPSVVVYGDRATENVTITLGPKAAVLTGRVVDAISNQPLKMADITVRRVDQPERFISTGLFEHRVKGGFRILVPSLPITLKVSQDGYQDWYYKGNGTQPSALLLAADSTKELLIRLQPVSTKLK